jgi:uncharacterized protein
MSESRDETQQGKAPEEEITAEKQGNGYILKNAAGPVGEITYRMVDADTWVLDHTYVDPGYRGGSLAKRLLNLVVDEAREKGRKIIPACSYAHVQFNRHAEYADVWHRPEQD